MSDYGEGTMTSLVTLTEDSGWPYAYQSEPAFGSVYRALETGTPNDTGFSLNPDGMLMFHTTQGNRICLPAEKLRETLHTAMTPSAISDEQKVTPG
jgi:aspartyl-tRNA synthetase